MLGSTIFKNMEEIKDLRLFLFPSLHTQSHVYYCLYEFFLFWILCCIPFKIKFSLLYTPNYAHNKLLLFRKIHYLDPKEIIKNLKRYFYLKHNNHILKSKKKNNKKFVEEIN